MPDALASLGGLFSNSASGATAAGGLGDLFKGLLTGFGLISNVMNAQKENSSLDTVLSYQKNPAKYEALLNSLTQPLSQGLNQQVGNSVQGYLGERGLTGSPNITAGVLAQQLAPYILQNQSQAASEANTLLNPAGAGFTPPSPLGPLLNLFNKPAQLPGGPGGTLPGMPGATPPTFQIPTDYGGSGGGFGGYGSAPPPTYTDSPIDPMAVYG